MGLRDRLSQLTRPPHARDEEELRELVASLGGTPISEARPRQEVLVVGEVASVRVVPRPNRSSWLEATVTDGHGGRLVAVWTGRTKLGGVEPGRRLMLAARTAPAGPGGRLYVYNPTYELL